MNQYDGEQKRGSRKLIKAILMILAIVTVALGIFVLGNYSARLGIVLGPNSEAYSSVFKDINDVEDFKALFEAREDLIRLYDGEVDNKTLLEGAIKGMTASLKDPYTVFMNKEEYDKFMESNSGSFMGIGVYVGVNSNEQVEVSSVIEGAPAEKAGIRAGDIIVKVNGTDIEGDSSKAVSLITGKEKAEVIITLIRDGGEPFDISVTRDVVKTISVHGEMIDNEVGYIQLTTFADLDASKEFIAKIEELKSKGMKGLILDLRGNGGGYLKEAVTIASQFVPKGEVITYTIDKYDKKVNSLSEGGIAIGMPLVILTDKGSASASEVVTGALRDYDAATTVGTTTYGKGVVQIPFELKSGIGGLKVTISRYYTPNGENIDKTGIVPDVEVEYPSELLDSTYDRNTDPQFKKGLEVIKEKIK